MIATIEKIREELKNKSELLGNLTLPEFTLTVQSNFGYESKNINLSINIIFNFKF